MGKVLSYTIFVTFVVWRVNAFSFRNDLIAASVRSQTTLTPVNSEDFMCVQDGQFPNSEHCSDYIHCSNGLASYMPCPEGLHFSSITERCESPCDAQCDKSLACICEWPSCKRSPKVPYVCIENGLFKDPVSCSFYVQCSNGTLNFMPCAGGLHFSEETQRCERPCEAKCEHSLACSCGWETCTPDVCFLPHKPGICPFNFPRWHYDRRTSTCKQFIYGGCGGNENHFETKEKCEKLCDVCTLEKDSGPCKGKIPRYYFDKEEGKCIKFTYGGCQGNRNNFRTKKQCEQKCLKRESELPTTDVEAESSGCPHLYKCINYCRSKGWNTGACTGFGYYTCECSGRL